MRKAQKCGKCITPPPPPPQLPMLLPSMVRLMLEVSRHIPAKVLVAVIIGLQCAKHKNVASASPPPPPPPPPTHHQPRDCLLNRLFRCRSKKYHIQVQIKKISKLRVIGLCAGNSPATGEFPAQMTSNAENVSIRRRHHGGTCISPHNSLQVFMIILTAVLAICSSNIVEEMMGAPWYIKLVYVLCQFTKCLILACLYVLNKICQHSLYHKQLT